MGNSWLLPEGECLQCIVTRFKVVTRVQLEDGSFNVLRRAFKVVTH
jgi:hypothetical protein